jgi:DNA-binding response OmpR family regulator
MSGKPLALIIEDDEKLAVIFTQALKLADFETITIHHGQEAMEQLDSLAPAVVVLDLHLPGVAGDKILSKIRQNECCTQTQVIVATADPAMADGLQDEPDLVLIKPVGFSQLRDLAARLRKNIRVD